jgi:hypothetical protein
MSRIVKVVTELTVNHNFMQLCLLLESYIPALDQKNVRRGE